MAQMEVSDSIAFDSEEFGTALDNILEIFSDGEFSVFSFVHPAHFLRMILT